jgi:hypothetical protein
MQVHLKDDIAYLCGDWTAAGMSCSAIDVLTDLVDSIEASGRKTLKINSAHLKSIDDNGAKYFSVWLNCLKLRGIECDLVNSEEAHEESFLYAGQQAQDICSKQFERNYLISDPKKRRKVDENRRDQDYRQAEAG